MALVLAFFLGLFTSLLAATICVICAIPHCSQDGHSDDEVQLQ